MSKNEWDMLYAKYYLKFMKENNKENPNMKLYKIYDRICEITFDKIMKFGG